MTILFTGCSWTWGSELEGVESNHEYRCANRFSGSHTNIAQNGISNEGIVRSTIKYIENNLKDCRYHSPKWNANNKVDFVVVQFTIMDRYSVYNNEWINLQAYMTDPKMKNHLARMFLKNFHNSVYAHNEFWRNVCLLENYLENRNMPYYFMRVDMDQHVRPEQTNEYREASKNKNMFKLCDDLLGHVQKNGKEPNPNYCPNLSHLNPYFGGGHPSVKGHKMIADHIQGILPK
tara:strand:- start:83 stop:781 length:699 start_codon:yes stop_codon:yes gene_type:complete